MILTTCSIARRGRNVLFPDNLRSLRKSLRQLVETELEPHDAAIEENGQIPSQALDAIRAFGLYGSNTLKRYDGLGLDMVGNCFALKWRAQIPIAAN